MAWSKLSFAPLISDRSSESAMPSMMLSERSREASPVLMKEEKDSSDCRIDEEDIFIPENEEEKKSEDEKRESAIADSSNDE